MGKESYVRGMLRKARRNAAKGEIYLMEKDLEHVRKYAAKGGIHVSPAQIREIENFGNIVALPIELCKAQRSAAEGEMYFMDTHLAHAKNYAEKSGLDISNEIREIENFGNIVALPIELCKAEKWAKENEEEVMNFHIEDAEKYSSSTGLDISEEIDRIRSILNP